MPEPAPTKGPQNTLSTTELVAMVASLSALNALSIDIMLPALPDMGADFGLTNDNDRQLVIVAYVSTFGIAQLVYGPLADAFGRRSVLVWALGLFIAGAVLSVLAPSFELLLAARALQGLGAAATRVISTSVVRDLTSGRRMAQIMSMAMTVFMIVPIVAPSLGQLILLVAPWRWIFGGLLIYSLGVLAWTLLRLPETLHPEYRRGFNLPSIIQGYAQTLSSRQTVGYMIASTFMAAALFSYITSSEQLFVDVFQLGDAFALAFGAVAIAISIGTFVNSRLVVRLGMRRISHAMTIWFAVAALIHAGLFELGVISFWSFLILLALTVGAFGMIAGNFNALAMEPVARIAGSASALFGAVTAFGGGLIGGLLARQFDGTAIPFLLGLAGLGVATFVAVFWTERGKVFRDPPGGNIPRTSAAD